MPEKEWVSLPDFGPMAPIDRHLTADFDGSDPAQANALALNALMDGASSILFWVHRDQDLIALCEDIDASIAPLHLVGNLDCDMPPKFWVNPHKASSTQTQSKIEQGAVLGLPGNGAANLRVFDALRPAFRWPWPRW